MNPFDRLKAESAEPPQSQTPPTAAPGPLEPSRPSPQIMNAGEVSARLPEAPRASSSSVDALSAPPPASEPAASAAAPSDPTERFRDVERKVQALRRRYAAGGMTRDQLKEELRRLMILDNDQTWWMIGLETDRWYRYNGREWVLATPPGMAAPASAPSPTSGSAASAPSAGANTPIDEFGIPLPQRVPLEDEGATIVGQGALYGSGGRGASAPATPEGATVPNKPVDLGATVPNRAVSQGQTVVSGTPEAWQRRLASAQRSGTAGPSSFSASPSIPAPGGTSSRLGTGSVAPAPGGVFQPDYGAKAGTVENSQGRGRLIIRVALISLFLVMILSLCGILGAVAFYMNIIGRYEGRIANLDAAVSADSQSVRFFDASNRQIFQLNDPNLGARLAVELNEVSPFMIHATVAIENERFYTDPGFDIVALIRAVLSNLNTGSGGGASTITQQLARARVLDPGAAADRSINRKISEIIVSSEIARRYSKSDILKYYLNTVYYGNLAYGVEAAARTYFNKSAKDLNLAESMFLAGLVQAPARYDPAIKPQQGQDAAWLARMRAVQPLVLTLGCVQMEHSPYDTQPFCVGEAEMRAATAQIAQVIANMYAFQPKRGEVTYPHFVQYVRETLENQFGQDALYNSGFAVYTTIDPRIQDLAQAAVKQQIDALRPRNVSNGAVLVMNPTTGAILAMVGSYDFYNTGIDGQVNVVMAPRQPGSSIKPIVYLAAMERAADGEYLTPASILWDVESCFGSTAQPYCPRNYDSRFHGPQSVRSSLANSYNIPAVKALAFAGIDHFKAVAQRLNIAFPLTQPETAGLATALGATEVRLFDLTRAYGALANGGKLVEPYSITRITRKREGQEEVVFERQNQDGQLQAEPGLAYLLTSILSDNAARTPAFGVNSPLQLRNGHLAAVKTGTTNENKDNWTVGYTPDFVVGVWVGNTRGEPMRNVSGIDGAAPIWNAVMTGALAGTTPKDFGAPPTVQQTTVCADYGTLDFQQCLNRRSELFFGPNPPPSGDTVFRQYQVDTFTGLVANEYCPEYVEDRVFLNISDASAINWLNTNPAGQEWAKERGLTLPIQGAPSGSCTPGMERPRVVISNPQPGQSIAGLLQVMGSLSMPNLNRYQLEVGIGQQPTAFGLVDGPIQSPPMGDNVFLARWDTSTVPNGVYTLKLYAVDNQGRFIERLVPVNVANGVVQPPGILPTETPSIVGTPFPTPQPFFTQPPVVTQPAEITPIFGFPTPTPIDNSQGGGLIFPPTSTPSQ